MRPDETKNVKIDEKMEADLFLNSLLTRKQIQCPSACLKWLDVIRAKFI